MSADLWPDIEFTKWKNTLATSTSLGTDLLERSGLKQCPGLITHGMLLYM
jgi:hypothetical protein